MTSSYEINVEIDVVHGFMRGILRNTILLIDKLMPFFRSRIKDYMLGGMRVLHNTSTLPGKSGSRPQLHAHCICCVMYYHAWTEQNLEINGRADSRLAPRQLETSLQSNTVSHWLGANLESALNGSLPQPFEVIGSLIYFAASILFCYLLRWMFRCVGMAFCRIIVAVCWLATAVVSAVV